MSYNCRIDFLARRNDRTDKQKIILEIKNFLKVGSERALEIYDGAEFFLETTYECERLNNLFLFDASLVVDGVDWNSHEENMYNIENAKINKKISEANAWKETLSNIEKEYLSILSSGATG